MSDSYETHLVVTEELLVQLAGCIDADYSKGSYTRALKAFVKGKEEIEEWYMRGKNATFMVRNEAHESYLFCKAVGNNLADCRKIMWDAYAAAGGNQKVQPKPY
jgi:hypothetical protein